MTDHTNEVEGGERYKQYLICKERGHVGSGKFYSNASYNALSWTICKYCGTHFATRTTTEIVEKNEPSKESE